MRQRNNVESNNCNLDSHLKSTLALVYPSKSFMVGDCTALSNSQILNANILQTDI